MIKLTNILNELEINKPRHPSDILKEMVKSDSDGSCYFETYILYSTYEEFLQEWGDHEDKNFIELAKMYYKWKTTNAIWYTYTEDDQNDEWENMPKAYKSIITYGLAYRDIRIILHNF